MTGATVPKAPKLKVRKLPPCGPVDVAAAWARIAKGADALEPRLSSRLARGTTANMVSAFEAGVCHPLPAEVRDSFRAHNGQSRDWGSTDAFFYGLRFHALVEAREVWRLWSGLAADEDLEEFARERGSSTPKGAIRLGYANRKWIPLADVGGSGHFGADLDPGPKGLSGQVINFGRDEEYKYVLAWSWGWFLNDLAEELERGNFRFEDGDRRGLKLIDPDPPYGSFYNAREAWSKAKTAGRRPFDPLTTAALAPLRASTTVVQLARGIAATRDFAALPVLADALEEAGCTDKRLLAHCRAPGDHGCGCWAVDLLLGGAPQFERPE